MKIVLASTVLVLSAAGCSDEADIGVDSKPITCSDGPVAVVAGDVQNPYDGKDYSFDEAIPTVSLSPNNGPTLVQLSGTVDNPDTQGRLLLRFSFRCGPAEIAKYGVIGDGQTQQLECPFQVPVAMLGQIEYLPATTGVLYIDETSNCLAGRFRVDFGGNGAVGGWFSAPWQ
jgi:hypothetical protein